MSGRLFNRKIRRIIRRIFRLPFSPLLLVAGSLFGPRLLAGNALFWGTPSLQFIPWWSYAWEVILGGHLPLWNPFTGMGAPLIANYQSALFYPPYWFYLFLYAIGKIPALAWGQALLVALHLVWAGAGMSLLVRRLGLGILAQAVSGLAFGFSGYLVSRAGFLSINSTVAWLPWVILFLTPSSMVGPLGRGLGAAGNRNGPHPVVQDVPNFIGLVICLSMLLLAGHAQTAWYTLLLAGMWVGFWNWELPNCRGVINPGMSELSQSRNGIGRVGRVMRAWGTLLLGILLAAGIAGVQLLPTAELLLQSQRATAVDYRMAMNYSFWPWRILTLFAPDFFGDPWAGDFWGYANYWEDALYVGLLPLFLAVGATARGIQGKKRPQKGDQDNYLTSNHKINLIRFLLGLMVVSFILALGKNTVVFPWLYRNIPSFNLFQAPTRYMIWAEFALALLAGLGAETWRRPEARALYWTRLGVAGAFAVTLGAGLTWLLLADVSPSYIRSTALTGILGVVAGVISLVAPKRAKVVEQGDTSGNSKNAGQVKLWRWAVVLFIAADLFIFGLGLNPAIDLDFYRYSSAAATVRLMSGGGRMYLPASDELALKLGRFFRFDSFDPGEDWDNLREAILPNQNLLDRLPSANNFDPMRPSRFVKWMNFINWAPPETKQRLLNLMNVSVVEKVDQRMPFEVRYERIASGQRARWTPCARIAQDADEAWDMVTLEKVDLTREVVLESNEAGAGETCEYDQSDGDHAKIEFLDGYNIKDPNRVVIRIDVPSSGWLELSDVWYPGWKAQIDGEARQVLHANYLFRAVPVESGKHEVIFIYQPISYQIGVLVSLLSLGIFSYLWLRRVPLNQT